MNATHSQGHHQHRLGSFEPGTTGRPPYNLDFSEWLTGPDEGDSIEQVEFAFKWEEEFARVLEAQEISWQYKPRTFAVEWDDEGNFVDSFTPDFYLPALNTYIELVPPDARTSSSKARKVRLLRQQQLGVRIELLTTASSLSAQNFLLSLQS
jgi:hypothetical protein